MKSLVAAASIAILAFSVVACEGTPAERSPSAPIAGATTSKPPPRTADELCDGLTWPRPMPAVVGLIFHDVGDSLEPSANAVLHPLACLNGLRGIGADGGIVWENGSWKGPVESYRIVNVSPSPGTRVGRNEPVTVTLVAVDEAAPSAYQPCAWVSTTEAASFFGGVPVTSRTVHDIEGSTDIGCHYERADNNSPGVAYAVDSELRVKGAHIVDAASEFAFRTAADSTRVDGIGIRAACTVTRNRSVRRLFVLIPGERIYIATGWPGGSCDVLTQFAHIAIPRIGP